MKYSKVVVQIIIVGLALIFLLQSTPIAAQSTPFKTTKGSQPTLIDDWDYHGSQSGLIPRRQAQISVCDTAHGDNENTHFIYLPMVATSNEQSTRANQPSSDNGSGSHSLSRLMQPSQTNTLGLKVAYLYSSDVATAQAFQAMFEAANLPLYHHPLANLANYDFSTCDAIMVSADSGPWQESQERASLFDTGLPVIGLGSGGLNLLKAGGFLSALPTGQSEATAVVAVNRGKEAYHEPTAVMLDEAGVVTLFASATQAHWISLDGPLPTGLEIGQLPQSTEFPIVQLENQHILWGFEAGPASMTQAGKDLLINLLSFQAAAHKLPLASRQFIPPAGIEQAILDQLASTTLPHLHSYAQRKQSTSNPECHDPNGLSSRGLTLKTYLFGQTYIATIAKGFDPNDSLVADCIRWIGQILPEDKVAPDVQANQFESWADNGDGTVNLLIQFYDDVASSDAEALLTTYTNSQTRQHGQTWAVVIASNQITPLSQQDQVRWIQAGPIPALPINDETRALMFVDEVQQAAFAGNAIAYTGLSGAGVAVAVYDTGFDDSHPDFAGKLLNASTQFDDHGTHVAGIVGGSGGNSPTQGGTPFQWRGMAPGVQMAFYNDDYTLDVANEALNDFNVKVTNASLKLGACGGAYDATWQMMDDLIRGDVPYDGANLPPHSMIMAAGNEGGTGQYCNNDTGYTSVFNTGKNLVTVGWLQSNDQYLLNVSSARGPTPDGRIKPELSAIGEMMSTVPGDGYSTKGGTSMASPVVSGIAALAVQQYKLTYGSDEIPPAAMKAVLVNNATDLINEPGSPNYDQLPQDPDTNAPLIYHAGPDHATGYGVVQAKRTVDSVAHADIIEGTISNSNDVDEYTIQVEVIRDELRFTLAWDDPGADPGLSATANHLVNNLDLVLEDPNGGLHYPWVVDTLPVNGNFSQADVTPAYRAQDNRNNLEQVVVWASDVDSEDWVGTWTVSVSASSLPAGPQAYSLVGDWRQIDMPANNYPLDGGYNQAPETVIIPVEVENPHLANISAAGGISPADWEVRMGHSSDWTLATVQATYGPVGDQVFLVVQPPNTLAANTLYDIAVWLMDEVQPNQHQSPVNHLIAATSQTDGIIFDDQPRPDVDEMIVVDNSGSMADFDKLESAQNAARAFVDRRRAGDMIGLSVFATGANTPYPLTAVSNNEAELGLAKNQINGMGANGKTAIGGGLLEAKNQLDTAGNADHTQRIVLLSDGMENVSPCWDTSAGHEDCQNGSSVQTDFVSDNGCPAIQVDTVAIGPADASWIPLLADIADQTCGQAYNATDDNGGMALRQQHARPAMVLPTYFPQTLANSLADVYQTIADDNTRQHRIWEEGGQANDTIVFDRELVIPAGLPEMTIAVNWSQPSINKQIQLTRPSGMLVQNVDLDAHIKDDDTHTVFRITTPEAGTWALQVLLGASAEPQEYFITASANTDPSLILTLGLPPVERVLGATLPIYVVLSEQAGTIKEATVELHIRRPDGMVSVLPAYDDGTNGDDHPNDGVYRADVDLDQAGNYQLKAVASGKGRDGEPFTLYQMRHFQVVGRPTIAYIFDADKTTADAYQSLLEQNNLRVQQIALDTVLETDFSTYDLIIIGPDTGKDGSWGSKRQVEYLSERRRKFLGLGDGGHAFFGQLNLDIGYNNGTTSTDTSVIPFNFAHPIWRTPFDLDVSGLVKVYVGAGSDGVAVFGIGTDLLWLASDPPNSTPLWLVQEANQYLIWGFNDGPQTMSTDGKTLFVNTVRFALE